MNTLLHSVQTALRGLRRTARFSLVAVLILAVGIGLSTAVFTVANALLLRRLPVTDQARLVVLWGAAPAGTFNMPVAHTEGAEFVRSVRSLQSAALFLFNGAIAMPMRDGTNVVQLKRALVSGEFFTVLGAQPMLGRALQPSDDVRGAEPVAVLSYTAWVRQFAADPRVLGRPLTLFGDSVSYTIVGVMPQGLEYPSGTDWWAPVSASLSPAELSLMAFYVIGRLAPDATPTTASNELTAFFRRAESPPRQRVLRGVANRWPRLVIGDVRPALIAFGAAAALLLLITCVNVSNLLLVRGFARQRELAVRSALGASRSRIVLELLLENALLASAGGAMGVVVAAVAVRTFVAFAPAGVPRLDQIHMSTAALVGAVAITAFAMMLFTLAPVLSASRIDIQQTLRAGTRQSASRRSRLLVEALVAAQLALAFLVLAAAGVITKSLLKLEQVDLAVEPSRVTIAELALGGWLQEDASQQTALLERLMTRLEEIPGVRAVTTVVTVPYSPLGGWVGTPRLEGQTADDAKANPLLNLELVSPSYFSTLGVSLLRGRTLTAQDRDGAPLAVVLSESAAQQYWPGADPIGKRLRFGAEESQLATVVGIVPDTRYRDLRDVRPTVYIPLAQSFFPFAPTQLAISTAGPSTPMIATIRRVIQETEPGVALASAAPFSHFFDETVAQPRLNALLLATFAAAAVVLAAVGVFGVMATIVRQRTLEFGIRMAFGATAGELRTMVLRRGLAIGVVGLVPGIVGALIANRLLSALLYDVSPTDPAMLGLATAFLLGVTVLASAIPARQSTSVEPLRALRAD